MFTFNPVSLAAPIKTVVAELQKDSKAPASFGRIETDNYMVSSAAGLANKTTGLKADADQRIEIGSQTKMMTATVVLQLAGEGKINLDDAISKYLPADMLNGIANSDTATVRQLLQMTSGIANYTDIATGDGDPLWLKQLQENPDRAFTDDDALNIIRGQPATGAPGAFNYSNTNYSLLGRIIETITEMQLAETFETRIFAPAGMTRSDLVGTDAPADLVRGYGTGDEGKLLDTTAAKWDKFAEGGVVSTTADMIKYIKALLVDGKLLDPAQLAEMKNFLSVQDTPELKFNFGLGLVEFEIPGKGKYFGFNGGTLGFLSSTYLSQETGDIASVGVNYADALTPTDEAVLKLLDAAKAAPAWKPITTFDAKTDVMKIQAADAASAHVSSSAMFKASFGDVSLKLPLELARVTTKNITFGDGSVLVVGDNTTSAVRDADANTIDIAKDFSASASKDNQLMGLGGSDRLYGAKGGDQLMGGDGSDVLNGRDGRDVLNGGAGRDMLWGGDDGDRFVFSRLTDSSVTKTTRDVIRDFDAAEDTISLSIMDANSLRDGNQAFRFIGSKAFDGKAGELHVVREGNTTLIEGDVNGDSKADFQIEVFGLPKLDASDFIL